MSNIQRGIDVVVYVDDKLVGGQSNARLNRHNDTVDITNQITGTWMNSIVTNKTWSITCSGMCICDNESYQLLENAFNLGKKVKIKITTVNNTMEGEALVTDFPITASFTSQASYNLTLTGVGNLG